MYPAVLAQNSKNPIQVPSDSNEAIQVKLDTFMLMSEIHLLQNRELYLCTTPNFVAPKEQKIMGNTPSLRQRNILYRCWEKDNRGHEDFESYYQSRMDKIAEYLKKELSENT